ncbi:MAG: type II secretion system F family protein [Candidatus Dojkabacteria bacterium]
MPLYKYTAIKSNGQKVEGSKEAGSREQLLNFLQSQDLTVLTLRESFSVDFKKLLNTEIGGISRTEKVIIAKQLATMISAGIPIIQAIGILANQSLKQNAKEKLSEIYKKIESGFTLSKAFRTVGGFFNEIQLSLIEAGEKSGNLNEMLRKVAEDMDKAKKLRGKIQGAMIYPAIIFLVLVAIIFIMVIFMVPQVEQLYRSLNSEAELPFITNLLVNFADTARSPLFIFGLLFFIFGAIAAYKTFTAKTERKVIVDSLKLKIPIFGSLMQKSQLSEFCRVSAMLIKSGISILDTISIVANSMGNSLYTKILLDSKIDVSKGSSFSLALAKNNIKEAFPAILIRIISTGEEAGEMDRVLNDMHLFYDDEVEQMTSNLTKLLEPFILVIVGGLVALLAVAIYLPIYNIGSLV